MLVPCITTVASFYTEGGIILAKTIKTILVVTLSIAVVIIKAIEVD